MPRLLERTRRQLQAKGHKKEAAYAIAKASLQKSGSMKPGSNKLTSKGKKRQSMGASGRAKSRAAKNSGRSPSAYKYNKKTNRATLKRG